jgi:hypothetical protein
MEETGRRPARHVYVIILIAVVYLIGLALLQKQGFWNVDNANKFLQLRAIVDSGYKDYSIPWPGARIDPDFEYNPIPHPFSVVQDHKLYSIYSPIFALVSSFFFRTCGFWGLYLLPLLFSVLLLCGIVRILRTLESGQLSAVYAVLIAGLCTPLWFYSLVFWEHIIAVCFCVWGISFFLDFIKSGRRRQLTLGALAAALSIYFRDELYLFCAVLIVAVFAANSRGRVKNGLWMVLIMVVALIPLWLIQWKTIGHPFGFHIGSHLFSASSISEHIADRPRVLYNLFVASSGSAWISLAFALPFILTFLINPRWPDKLLDVVVPLYCLVALGSSIMVFVPYLLSNDHIAHLLRSNSLFAASPILILAFMRHSQHETPGIESSLKRWLWLVALAYAVVYGLTAPLLGSTGIHWGNRFLLLLYPLFAILCAANLAGWHRVRRPGIDWRRAVVILTVLVSLAAQVYSLSLLGRKKAFSYRLNQEVQKSEQGIIATNLWWVPQELYSVFFDRPIFLVRSSEQYHQLKNRLVSVGQDRLLWITPPSENIPRSSATEVSDGGLNFYEVWLVPMYVGDAYGMKRERLKINPPVSPFFKGGAKISCCDGGWEFPPFVKGD